MQNCRRSIWIFGETSNREAFEETFGVQFDVHVLDRIPSRGFSLDANPALAFLFIDDGQNWLDWVQEELTPETPFVVFSRTTDLDFIRAVFKMGAADYLILPFKPAELIFRSERILRHGLLPSEIKGTAIQGLTAKERRLLATFIVEPSGKVSRDELFKSVWRNIAVDPKTLDVHLFNLRRKLRLQGFDIVASDAVYRLTERTA